MTNSSGFPDPGQLFEGRYRVGSIIGSGGFARVYRAKQEDLGRDVALKILTPSEIIDGTPAYPEKIVKRFNREAKLVSRLQDPHTITMYDYGQTDRGMLYMVFEFVNGLSVSELVSANGALPWERVVRILDQSLRSLEEAHALGVMHRDIKPSNIMVFEHVGRADQVKILDFGIAKLSKSGSTTSNSTTSTDLTADGMLVGTPRYMSPEQIRGEEIKAGSDLYSLGLVAYEMLVGAKAIEATSSVTIIGLQLDPKPFTIPDTIDAPAWVRHVIEKMMHKEAAKRYGSAAEVLSDLQNRERVVVPATIEHVEPIVPPKQRTSVAPIVAVVLIASVVASGLWLWKNQTSEPELAADTTDTPYGERVATSENAEDSVVAQNEMNTMTIGSDPIGAPVKINGVAFGSTPLKVAEDRIKFPAVIEVEHNGQTKKRQLQNFETDVSFELAELAEVKPPDEAEVPIVIEPPPPRKKKRRPKTLGDPKKDRPPKKAEPDPPKKLFKPKPVFVPMDVNQ